MSRFRAFQTRINQGFLEGVKGCVIHLSFPLKTPPKSVTEPTDRHHKEVNPIADYMTAGTELPAYLPYPRFLLETDLSHTARELYALLLDRSTLRRRTAGRTARDGHTLSTP